MEATLLRWIAHYGYASIFALLMFGIVGLPVPDETLLALSGYLVHRGDLGFLPTVLAALGGSVCGITLSYALGRRFGRAVVLKYGHWLHLSEEILDRALGWFSHRGKYALTLGYFFPGVRHAVALAAGSSKLPVRTFAVFAYAGALAWCTAFVSLGYFLGEAWPSVLHALRQPVAVVVWVGAGMLLVVLLWRNGRPEAPS